MFILFVWVLGVASGVGACASIKVYNLIMTPTISTIQMTSNIAPLQSQKIEVADTTAGEWMTGEASAYTASIDETDGNPNITASGETVRVGGIACPSRYSFGQKIEIKGLGVFECNDRMNSRYREVLIFDIFKLTKSEAISFGRQKIEFRTL